MLVIVQLTALACMFSHLVIDYAFLLYCSVSDAREDNAMTTHALVLVYRCLKDSAPYYLSSLIFLRSINSQCTCALRSPAVLYDLVPPSAHVKSQGMRAFKNVMPILWNKLPLSVRSSSSLSQFHTTLKNSFFREAFKR